MRRSKRNVVSFSGAQRFGRNWKKLQRRVEAVPVRPPGCAVALRASCVPVTARLERIRAGWSGSILA
jgi:hypothetical protein